MIRLIVALAALGLMLPSAFAAGGGEREGRKANRLVTEASPYLRQHAYNPIDWYPWGKDAFEKAARENKPVFLSVGYSTCHWCHVMARESFENDEIAAILNENFVSIKVDRERRPDVDETYMLATELISRRGGWPNSLFLTPKRKPFFGATYFPPDSFKELIGKVANLWESDRATLESDAERVATVISTVLTQRVEAAAMTPEALAAAADKLLAGLDEFNGGFSTAPKFPQESVLLFLLRLAERDGNAKALEALTLTLDNIIRGGIHDHVGGGFHRYAVDAEWRIPHFEKMLYNQALLTRVLVGVYRLTGTPRYAAAARRTIDYVLADLTDAEGGFYSARDADSEGHEGRFYAWTPDGLADALGKDDAAFAATVFGVTGEPNFEDELSVLYLAGSTEELATKTGLDRQAFLGRVADVRRRLFAARQAREAPHRDEKVITAWNGMMIASLAEAAETLGEARYREAALKAGTFVWNRLRAGGELKRAYFEGKAALEGQQEDYAYSALAFIGLYDLTGDAPWLERAETLTQDMVTRFRDDSAGDYYMTASVETFARSKARTDGGIPSGNAVALEVFAKLAERSRDPEHRRRGEALLAALSGLALDGPIGNGYALMAGDHLQRGDTGPNRYLAKGIVHARGRLDAAKGRLVVGLDIAPGWHINADRPLEEFFIPTKLEVEGSAADAVTYPVALRRKLGFHDKELALYEGHVELVADVKAGGPGAIRATLTLQACSDEICLAPETALLAVPDAAR